ncbi:Histidine kinase-, DNA gyrase B-, and HSP90-like ATPase [Acetoanaerobium noterae]|uniref:histidine kinase n=1 Tax=Acetoanaerobium noterae TaxID=745369 RepID=A0A1T5C5K0_9FIRM|nr:sensor histidine kinase [Acetoanaerobium noterae]SKB54665.1 Histidine kinase-, DNA gyrase B-, and HSP90-like ATPase [Acetoanaerobium noterae]
MDTSLNQSEELIKQKASDSGIKLISVIILLALISVGLYNPLKSIIFPDNQYINTYQSSESFVNYIENMTWDLLEKNSSKDEFDFYQKNQYKDVTYYLQVKDELATLVTNTNLLPNQILSKSKQSSSFYIHIKLDENLQAISKDSSMDETWEDNIVTTFERLLASREDIKGKELELLLMIPKNVYLKNGALEDNIKNFYLERYMILILAIGSIIMFLILVWAGFTNTLRQQNNSFIKAMNKIPMEVKCLIYILFGVGFALTMELLFNDNLSRYYSPKLKFETIISDANIFFYLIGIPVTIFLYTALYVLVSDIKNVFNSGIYESCIKKSLIGKFFLKLFKKLNSTFSKLMSFDISNTKNRKLMLVLGINLIIVWIIVFFTSFVFLYIVFGMGGSYSLFGSVVLGMCIAIIYSLFIFSYLKDRMCELEQLYMVTDEISLGNFNQHMELNLGIFNPILEKLNSISEGFKIAVDEEIKSQNLKTELISNVSHDLKTPLTSIISYIDLLKKENDMSETQKEYIEILEQKSQRLTLLIEDLFEASKAASGNISFNKSSLDLVSLLRQTIAENENEISASGLLFKIQLPDSEQKIICNLDGKRTYRIFDNLISNILKYSLPSSRVYIDVSLNMNKALIVFKNISAYEMNFNPNDIAERFVRGDKSRNTDGSGLGLSIAKSFTELQGGDFNIYIDGDLFKVVISFEVISEYKQ